MASKTLHNNLGFDDIFSQLLFTAVALELAEGSDAKALVSLAAPINQLLTRWEELDRDRQSQQRATTRANVLGKQRNLQLDTALTDVHNATLAEVEQKREAPLFMHLFPKPLSTLIKPALDNQLKITESFLERLKTSAAPAALRNAHDEPLETSIAKGQAAQKERVVAVAAAAALTTRINALRDDGNAALQHVDGALKQIAAKRRLGKQWVDSFFPDSPSRPTKKPAPAPGPQGTVAATPAP